MYLSVTTLTSSSLSTAVRLDINQHCFGGSISSKTELLVRYI